MPEALSSDLFLRQAKKIRANRKLGQNFFVDLEKLELIVEALDLDENDHVLEIGPGLGFLTRVLSTTGATIYAVELDRNLVEKLEKQNLKGVNVIHHDFLDFDLSSLGAKNLKIVGNIPYQITSPIIAKIFGEIGSPSPWLSSIERVVMTMQLEVAQRLVAKPGTKAFSQITLLKEYYFDAQILFTVPPECFYPVPEVNSATVFLDKLEAPPVSDTNIKLLKQIIRAGFRQRRKMLKNNLSFLKIDEATVKDVLKELNLNPLSRAEDLSLAKFAVLTNRIEELIAQRK